MWYRCGYRRSQERAGARVLFPRLGDQKVLAVLVTRSGLVRDRILRLDLPQGDLGRCGTLHQRQLRGWTMEAMRNELARRLEQERR